MKTKYAKSLISKVIAAIVIIAALALAGTIDAQDAERSHQQYCAMVAQWDRDAELGIAPEQRAGWPPYDGRKQCKAEETKHENQ